MPNNKTSIQDFLKTFRTKNYQDFNKAFNESMGYLARYYADVTTQSSNTDLNEIAYVIKNEIAKMIAKKQIESNDNDLSDMHDKGNENLIKSLFSEPLETMAYYIKEHKNDVMETITDKDYKSNLNYNYDSIQQKLLSSKIQFQKFELNNSQNQAFDILSSIEANLPLGENAIEDSINRQKPGFFEKVFRRTSKEYKTFIKIFNGYKDKQSPLYGQNEYLKNSAFQYLKHKFPNLKDDEIPTLEQINTIKGIGKERAFFCYNVVKAINENEQIQERANDLVREIKHTKVDYPFKIEQEEFQKSLLEKTLEKEALEANKPNENEYDSKYDQLEVHDKQNIFE